MSDQEPIRPRLPSEIDPHISQPFEGTDANTNVMFELPSIPDPPEAERHGGPRPRLGTLREIVRDPELAEKIIAENSVTERNRGRAMRRLGRRTMFYS